MRKRRNSRGSRGRRFNEIHRSDVQSQGQERGVAQGDYFYGGPRRQREDWSSRSYDQNPYDRAEGMYGAGGEDFSERMVDAYGYFADNAGTDWHGSGGGWNDQSSFEYREDRPYRLPGRSFSPREKRKNFPEGQRAAGIRREQQGFMNSVRNFFGVGPKGYHRSDDRIREDVCEALARHPEVDASDLEVEVKDGLVTLTGTVPDRWMRRQAEDAVESVNGVEDVQMAITIARNSKRRAAG